MIRRPVRAGGKPHQQQHGHTEQRGRVEERDVAERVAEYATLVRLDR
jgi:hypothetical protein